MYEFLLTMSPSTISMLPTIMPFIFVCLTISFTCFVFEKTFFLGSMASLFLMIVSLVVFSYSVYNAEIVEESFTARVGDFIQNSGAGSLNQTVYHFNSSEISIFTPNSCGIKIIDIGNGLSKKNPSIASGAV
jgi:hypothetical protein